MTSALCADPPSALSEQAGSSGLLSVYPGEYVVTLKEEASQARGEISALTENAGISSYGQVLERIGLDTVVVASPAVRVNRSRRTAISSLAATLSAEDAFCKGLLAQNIATSCTPNYQLRTADLPVNDPLASSLWGLSSEAGIDVARAWNTTTGSSDVVVAVIDTGIDYTHPDLVANLWRNPGEVANNGIDDDQNGFIDDVYGVNTAIDAINRANPFDDNGHGTHVAGTIGATGNNHEGIVGINQNIRIMAIKFMDATGAGRLSDAISAINYMTDMKVMRGVNVRVSNNSWGGGAYSKALETAIKRAQEAGIIFVAAAGNSALDVDVRPSYPSSYEVSNVVAVTAVDRDGNIASFANYGAEGVDISAPGVDILSTVAGGGYKSMSGTSMATPHVVGVLGLLFAAEPQLTMDQAIARLYETGRSSPTLFDSRDGRPLIRTGRIVNAGRLIANETEALPPLDNGLPPCGYTFQVANLASGQGIDQAADSAPIVNQSDEGDFYALSLPFKFPFFRTSTDTLWLSPNGVVYLQEPLAMDFEVASRAPNNSIAALQADLTPRAANQGVRVQAQADRVTIAWQSEHYATFGAGPVSVRLTLFPNGIIQSSVSFDNAGEPVALRQALLGNPFTTPETAACSIIGASANSSRLSSTLDMLAVQRQLITSPDDAFGLGVVMVPTCFDAGQIGLFESPRVTSIRVRLSSNRRKVLLSLTGTGTGKVPLSATVFNKECARSTWADLVNGRANLRVPLPRGANKIKFKSGSALGVLRVNTVASRVSKAQIAQICSSLVSTLSRR